MALAGTTRGGMLARRVLWPLPRARAHRRLGRRYELADGFERVYLYHVRKTGGTSLSESFLALGGEDPAAVRRRLGEGWGIARSRDVALAAHARPALQGGRYLFGWSHIPAWDIELPPRTFTVTVLRDPAARVASLYSYLADPAADEGQPFPAPAGERRRAAAGFERFLELTPREELLGQLAMFSEGCDPAEAAARIERCSLAFRLQNMEPALAELSRLTGRRLQPRHARRSASRFEPSDAQGARLRELLAPEYELLERLRL